MATAAADKTTGAEVSKRPLFENTDLRNIQSFQDAERLLAESGIGIVDATDVIGDGFEMLEDKEKLVDVPIIIMQWIHTPGDYKDPNTGEKSDFCILRCVTGDGKKYIITDGSSTGISRQLRDYQEREGRNGGVLVKRGLRVSHYQNEFTDDGTTFYLNV